MGKWIRYAAGLFLLIHAIQVCAQDPPTKVFRAGAAASNITPWLGVSIAGNMNDRPAMHVHDELYARAIVLDDGTTKLAFVMVDSCMVPREITDAAKAMASEGTGIPASNMLVAATHTHTAACATPVFQSDPDPEYQRYLTVKISDGIRRANTNLQPARIGWGAGSVPDEVFNRRWFKKPGTIGPNPFGKEGETVQMNPPRASEDLVEPAGPIDPEVSFVAVQSLEGKPIALLANYSLHYVGGTGPDEISADYFGIFARRMGELLNAGGQDKPFVGMMSNGTSGNINNINFRVAPWQQQPYEQMTRVANKVAGEVYKAYQSVRFQEWVPLAALHQEIEVGVRLPSVDEVAQAKEIVAKAAGPDMKGLTEIYARETVFLSEYPATKKLILQCMRIGDLSIAAIPCEVFVEIGLAIKEKSPFDDVFTISLANGYNGYLPTKEQHGYGGYETWRARSSYLEVDAADTILATVLELLESLPNDTATGEQP
ncbi:MAG: hypothetical protein AMXMBFR84_30850 [Candidatus Hydrogenedentota bacterium]